MTNRALPNSTLLILGLWCGIFGALLIAHGADVDVSPVLGFSFAFLGVAAAVVTASLICAASGISARSAWIDLTVGLLAVLWGALGAPTSAASALAAGGGTLLICTRVGALLGGRVPVARYVWPLVIVAVGADLWSVMAPTGLTRQAVVEAPPTRELNLLLLTVPLPGGGIDGILGLGDVVFSGFLLGLAQRCGLSLRRAVVGLSVGFLACLVFLLVMATPAPALVFIGPAFAGVLGAAVRPRGVEVLQGVVFVGALWGIGALL